MKDQRAVDIPHQHTVFFVRADVDDGSLRDESEAFWFAFFKNTFQKV
jgi:hypothetical protein